MSGSETIKSPGHLAEPKKEMTNAVNVEKVVAHNTGVVPGMGADGKTTTEEIDCGVFEETVPVVRAPDFIEDETGLPATHPGRDDGGHLASATLQPVTTSSLELMRDQASEGKMGDAQPISSGGDHLTQAFGSPTPFDGFESIVGTAEEAGRVPRADSPDVVMVMAPDPAAGTLPQTSETRTTLGSSLQRLFFGSSTQKGTAETTSAAVSSAPSVVPPMSHTELADSTTAQITTGLEILGGAAASSAKGVATNHEDARSQDLADGESKESKLQTENNGEAIAKETSSNQSIPLEEKAVHIGTSHGATVPLVAVTPEKQPAKATASSGEHVATLCNPSAQEKPSIAPMPTISSPPEESMPAEKISTDDLEVSAKRVEESLRIPGEFP